jgi:hypothetical protein
MGLQQRAAQYGSWRYYPKAAVGHGGIVPLIRAATTGGITNRSIETPLMKDIRGTGNRGSPQDADFPVMSARNLE